VAVGHRDQRPRAMTIGLIGSLSVILTVSLGLLTEVGADLLPPAWTWLKDPRVVGVAAAAAVALLIIVVMAEARLNSRGTESDRFAEDGSRSAANTAAVTVSGGHVGQVVSAPGGTVHLTSSSTEAELRHVIDDLFKKNLGDRSSVQQRIDVYNAPGALSIAPPLGRLDRPVRGRTDLLSSLLAQLNKGNASNKVHVLCGLGGCGKSTIALKVAQYAIDHSMQVWWVSSSNSTTLHSGMRQVAAELGATQEDLLGAWGGRVSATDLVWRLLDEHRTRWFLIIDNADEPSDLSAGDSEVRDGTGWLRIPKGEFGSILVTSRDCNADHWAAWCTLHEIPKLDSSDAADVLIDRAGTTAGDITDAQHLAARLEGLPLALHLAGTYLRSNAGAPWDGAIKTFEAYETALNQNRLDVVYPELKRDYRSLRESEARWLIGATWQLSLDLLDRRGYPECRALLQVLSHLAFAAVPFTALTGRGMLLGGALPRITPDRAWEIVSATRDLGLVAIDHHQASSQNAEARTILSIHRLVQDLNRYYAKADGSTANYESRAVMLAMDAAERIAGHPDNPAYWPEWQLVAPHFFYLIRTILNRTHVANDTLIFACYGTNLCAKYLASRGLYQESESWQRLAYETMNRLVGPTHDGTILARYDLAAVLQHMGKYSEARSELEALQETEREVWDDENLHLLATRQALADVLMQLGEYPKAEAVYRQVLSSYNAKGVSDRNYVATRHNLAHVLLERGKPAEAHEQLSVLKDELPAFEWDTTIERLLVPYTMARVKQAEGRYEEAMRSLRQLLPHYEETYGKMHLNTLKVRHEIGCLLEQMGRPKEAVTQLRELLDPRTKALGPGHPEVVSTRHQLALALKASGDVDGARKEFEEVLRRRSVNPGALHPDTLATRHELAVIKLSKGQLRDAKKEFEDILRQETESLGYDHASTVQTRLNLIAIYMQTGQLVTAARDLRKLYEAHRKNYGEKHPETLKIRLGLELLEKQVALGRKGRPRDDADEV
jgi:tetratricopeptide (TPR) repeat protein